MALMACAIEIPLACGNTVVLKSSEFCLRCAEIVVDALYKRMGFRRVNLIHVAVEDARSPKAVANIIGDKRIWHISVLDDADVEEAVRSIIFGRMIHSSQVCLSTERVIVQRGVSEAFITALTTIVQKIRAGIEPNEVLVGDLANHGALLQPHILLGVEPGRCGRLSRLAHQTDYSFIGSLWTRDLGKGLSLARKVHYTEGPDYYLCLKGQIQINAPTVAAELGACVIAFRALANWIRSLLEHFTRQRAAIIGPPSCGFRSSVIYAQDMYMSPETINKTIGFTV
ncbi:Aldehyde/histidinol dehydrogenase [Gautieria morchelliformis]|nr:Aldehyde/histidinol dehydrogenase [Gautieria morchelliformis]